MIDIDRTVPLRSKAQLLELIEAVVEAEPVDEAEWIEWKGLLELDRKDGQFHVARAVLGLANRMPDDAARWCGGYGYVLVGVQPGGLVGVEPVDGADFTPGVDGYTGGSEGPRWELHWLRIGAQRVLVVVVDPPKWGDRVWRLWKNHGTTEGAPETTVFVRRGSITAPASVAQIKRLEARERHRHADVAVEIAAVGQPLAWFEPAAIRAEIGTCVERAVAGERAASEAIRRPPPAGAIAPIVGGNGRRAIDDQLEATRAVIGAQLTGQALDRRSWPQYEQELAEWAQQLRAALSERFMSTYHTLGCGRLRLIVTNPSGRHLSDVELTITLPAGVDALAEVPGGAGNLPAPPPRWGDDFIRQLGVEPEILAAAARWRSELVMPGVPVVSPFGPWVEDGRIVAPLGSLRQRDRVRVDPVWLQLRSGDAVELGWVLRSPDLDDAATGSVALAVADGPVTFSDLLGDPLAADGSEGHER